MYVCVFSFSKKNMNRYFGTVFLWIDPEAISWQNSPMENKQKFTVKNGGQLSIKGEDFKALLEEVLEKGKRFRFQSGGFSMQPFIRNGDVVTLAPYLIQDIQVGDVVAYEEPVSGLLKVHRVVGERIGLYLIKGDNSLKTDGWIQRDSIYGRVIRIERKGKTVSFSLGPEKRLVAAVSRSVTGRWILYNFWQLVWLLRKGFVKKNHL